MFIVYLTAFCISTYLYVQGHRAYDSTASHWDGVRFGADIVVLLLTLYYTVGAAMMRALCPHDVRKAISHSTLAPQFDELSEMYEVGVREYTSNGWNVFDFSQVVLVWLALWLRLGDQAEAELAVMAVSSVAARLRHAVIDGSVGHTVTLTRGSDGSAVYVVQAPELWSHAVLGTPVYTAVNPTRVMAALTSLSWRVCVVVVVRARSVRLSTWSARCCLTCCGSWPFS